MHERQHICTGDRIRARVAQEKETGKGRAVNLAGGGAAGDVKNTLQKGSSTVLPCLRPGWEHEHAFVRVVGIPATEIPTCYITEMTWLPGREYENAFHVRCIGNERGYSHFSV